MDTSNEWKAWYVWIGMVVGDRSKAQLRGVPGLSDRQGLFSNFLDWSVGEFWADHERCSRQLSVSPGDDS
jgi:hypothetical protein